MGHEMGQLCANAFLYVLVASHDTRSHVHVHTEACTEDPPRPLLPLILPPAIMFTHPGASSGGPCWTGRSWPSAGMLFFLSLPRDIRNSRSPLLLEEQQ